MQDRARTTLLSPLRVAVAAALLVAIYVASLYVTRRVPDGALAVVGGPTGLDREGGLVLRWRPPPGASDDAITAALASQPDVRFERDGDVYVISIVGVDESTARNTARVIETGRYFEMREVIEGDAFATLAKALGLAPEIDTWRGETDARSHHTWYLHAPRRAELVDAIPADRLPANTELGLELVEGYNKPSEWHAYLIGTEVLIDATAVANATGSYDSYTNRPIVLIDFTREGGAAFGDVTRRLSGHKLATLVGDHIVMAPVINGPILGGRASIAMGGSDPRASEIERDTFIAAMKAGSRLPRGGTVVRDDYVAPVSPGAALWLAVLVLALGWGCAVGALAAMIARYAGMSWRARRERGDGGAPWLRLAITLVAPAVLIAAPHLGVPGIDADALDDRVTVDRWFEARPIAVGPMDLGLRPVIFAFVVIELLALVVGAWRARRIDGGGEGRRVLAPWVIALAIAAALVEGYFHAERLQGNTERDIAYVHAGLLYRLAVAASFAAGTAVLIAIAALISSRGLGNGYAVVIASGWLIDVVTQGERAIDVTGIASAAGGVPGALALAVLTCWLVRVRVGRSGLAIVSPASGLLPMFRLGGIGFVSGALSALGLGRIAALATSIGWLGAGVVGVIFAVALGALWSYAFARPSQIAALAVRANAAAPDRRAWIGAAALACLAALGYTLARRAGLSESEPVAVPMLGDAMYVAVGAAALADVVADWRGRRGPPGATVAVWPVQQAQHVELVERVLGGAGIRFHVQSLSVRPLLAIAGSWVPMTVFVPAADAARAESLLRALFDRSLPPPNVGDAFA